MFISRINGSINNKAFKGYEHVKDPHGKTVHCFHYPYDSKERSVELEFFKLKRDDNFYTGYSIDETFEPVRVKLDKEADATAIDLENLLGLKKNEPCAYRVHVQGDVPRADTGIQITQDAMFGENKGKNVKETYTVIPRSGTKPLHTGGLGYLIMIDTHLPGAQYKGFESENTGKVVYHENIQKEKEQIKRNSSNKVGGTLAGIEYDIPDLAKKNITTIYLTPFAGADTVYYHGYHNKNVFRIANNIGNIENFDSLAIKAFQNDVSIVFDAPFTSEGAEGVNVQYALKWAQQKPRALYRFHMDGIQDAPIGFGFVPENDENLRHKLINSPYILQRQDNNKVKVVDNPEYDKKKPTLIQIYDAKQVTKEQVESKEPIKEYQAPVIDREDKLAVNTYQDIVPPQKMEITDLKIYKTTLENAADFINSSDKNLEINSPEVTYLVASTPSFEFSKKSKNISLWEDKVGLCLRNHGITYNDEKRLNSIPSEVEREIERANIIRGSHEAIDTDIQISRYWTQKHKDAVIYNYAGVLKDVKSVDDLDKLIEAGKLPASARLSSEAFENIKKGLYQLETKNDLERDDTTVRALMKLYLPSLEFAEDTGSLLSQEFFFNLAPNKELRGLTRFELEQMGNPHLDETNADVYLRTNKLFTHDIKNFADAIIEEIDRNSKEKLLTEDGEYTEYGEYVIDHIGADIAKYAFIKSLMGDDFIGKYVKAMPDTGDIKFNYIAIEDSTSLKAFGINETDMVENASDLQKTFQKGMKKLNSEDVKFLADAYSKQLEGRSTMSFRLSEACYDVAGRGLKFRIDAAKNIKDVDAVKQLSNTKDEFIRELIEYYQDLVQAICDTNESSSITAEVTDMESLSKASWGNAKINDFDGMKEAGSLYKDLENTMRHFYISTGITTEAGYSNFFSSVFRTFSKDFEIGGFLDDGINTIAKNLKNLMNSRSVENIKEMFNFVSGHDKPRVVHYSALDMDLFYNTFAVNEKDLNVNKHARITAMTLLQGKNNFSELPLELKLNIHNTDYFRTVSSKSIAMGELLTRGVNEAIAQGKISKEMEPHFKNAIANLIEGKYLKYGEKVERETIDIPELKDIKQIATTIISDAENKYGLKISNDERNIIINRIVEASNSDRIAEFSVQANKDDLTSERIDWIFTSDKAEDIEKRRDDVEYAAFTASLLAFIKVIFQETCNNDSEKMKAFTSSAIDFINKYDKEYIDTHSKPFPYHESAQNAERKNGFGGIEFEDALEMLMNETELLAGKEIADSNEILKIIYKTIHEPAMKKSIGMAALLCALPGVASIYDGEEIGITGGEEKSNNLYNKNRNAVMIEALKTRYNKEYIQNMKTLFESARIAKAAKGAEALNQGTPYEMLVRNEDKTLVDRVNAWFMQSKDSMVITVATDKGARDAREHYQMIDNETEVKFPYLELAEGLAIPDGTIFKNILSDDKTEYVAITETIKDSLRRRTIIKPKDIENFVINKITAPNRTLVLARKLENNARKIAFHGRQYNISAPIYQTYNNTENKEGQKLSIIAK